MKISFIFILLLFCSLHSYGTTPKIKVYCNPVLAKSTPDPTVIQAPDGMFYLYATEDIHNIPIYKSPDLVNWTFVGTAFTDATRPTFEPKAGLWAPDINHIDGKYVLYYAMSRWGGEHTCGIGCAVADSPAGPFTDQGKLFRSNEIGVQNSIDPFYIEENGEKYLAHTLNNTVVAPPRMLIAFLENNLEFDGKNYSVRIPRALRPYMGGKDKIIQK